MSNLYFALLYIVAFAIPFPYIFGAASIILLFTGWLFTNLYRETFQNISREKVLWPSLAFFAINAFSYFYSYDKSESLWDTQQKLSFLIMPVLIGAGKGINTKQLERIFSFYLLGLSIMAIFCITRATAIYLQTGNNDYFFYHKLVYNCDTNAVYYSWYTFFALVLLLFYDWKSRWATPVLYYFVYFLLVLFFILLSSKTLLVLFVVVLMPISIVRNIRLKRINISTYIGYGIQLFAICLFIFTANPIRARFEDLTKDNDKNVIKHGTIQPNQKFNNLTLRFMLWHTAVGNIKENNLYWIGGGNGSVKYLQRDMLLKLYGPDINKNQDSELWNFNIHNAYLQTLMMTGIPGLLMLLLMIFLPFLYLKSVENRPVFIFFFAVTATFMMQESIVQTQAGIVFFVFFSQVFWNVCIARKKERILLQLHR